MVPGVDNAVKIYKNMRNGNEPELRGVLLLCTSTDKILGKFAIRSDEAIGYDTDGNEVARLPLVESQIRRVFHDSEREVYRHNIT